MRKSSLFVREVASPHDAIDTNKGPVGGILAGHETRSDPAIGRPIFAWLAPEAEWVDKGESANTPLILRPSHSGGLGSISCPPRSQPAVVRGSGRTPQT